MSRFAVLAAAALAGAASAQMPPASAPHPGASAAQGPASAMQPAYAARPATPAMPAMPAISAPPPVPQRTPAPPAPPTPAVKVLPPDAPKVVINGGTYSERRDLRMAIVNGTVVHEGADVGGVVVDEIRRDGVVLAYRGAKYHVMY